MSSTPPPLGASPHASRTSSPPPPAPCSAGRGSATAGGGAGSQGPGARVKFCVNHGGRLEALRMPLSSTAGEVAERAAGAAEAPAQHKLFVFRGKLLDPGDTLLECGLVDGCVLHMVLNESPETGKAVHVRDSAGTVRTVRVTEHYTVEDVKEEVACFVGAPPPEAQQLAFAGRLLDNAHTLGEYNIQKPSVLQLLPPARPRQLEQLVSVVSPHRWDSNVPTCSVVSIGFGRPSSKADAWRPILSSLMMAGFELRAFYSQEDLPGSLRYDQGGQQVTFRPEEPLRPGTHYRVTVNRNDGMWMSDASGEQARLRGSLRWDFFTQGYAPLRITAVYPRPHSRVRPRACVIVSFSKPLCREAVASDWVSVRCGSSTLPLLPPRYDEATNSLVIETCQPLPPNKDVRVRVRPQHVCGADGESLLPLQADGILKTSALRWKFHTTHGSSEVSRYEYDNLNSAGVGPVLRRWQEGRVSILRETSGRGGGGAARSPGASSVLEVARGTPGRGSSNGMWYTSGEGGVGREVVNLGEALLSNEGEQRDRGDDDEHSIQSWQQQPLP